MIPTDIVRQQRGESLPSINLDQPPPSEVGQPDADAVDAAAVRGHLLARCLVALGPEWGALRADIEAELGPWTPRESDE